MRIASLPEVENVAAEASVPTFERDLEQKETTKHFEEDSLRVYLRHMGAREVLSRSDELQLACRLQDSRKRLHLSLLAHRDVYTSVVDSLRRIHESRLRLDRFLDVAVANVEEKRRLRNQIGTTLAELDGLDKENLSDFRIVMNRKIASRTRRRAWQQIVFRRYRAGELILRLKPRTSQIVSLLPRAEARTRRMRWLHTIVHRRSSERHSSAVRPYLQQLKQQSFASLDSVKTLERRLRITHFHLLQFNSLRRKLAASHLRFVVSVAKQFRGRGMSMLDLIQEGNLGLLKATEKFDPKMGYRLTTYAEWWIRQAIQSALHRSYGSIRVPHSLLSPLRQIKISVASLVQLYGREPTQEEVAESMGVSTDRVQVLEQFGNKTLSLSQPIADDEGILLMDLIPNRDTNVAPLNDAIKSKIEQVMQVLNPREREILRLRFGFDGGKRKTLTEIGRVYSLSRERIRQIESKAVKKLQRPDCRNQLADLVDYEAN